MPDIGALTIYPMGFDAEAARDHLLAERRKRSLRTMKEVDQDMAEDQQ